MLTTTLDGLWVLQVLSGIEILAPELGLRPHLPSVETPEMALALPVTEDLKAAGAVTSAGVVDETVLEWLTVLARRDTALLMLVRTPGAATDDEPERVTLARFSRWWVRLERSGIQIRLSGAGEATSEQSASWLIESQIESLCGQMPPLPIKPVTLDVVQLLGAVRQHGDLSAFLTGRGCDADQISALGLAADCARSAQASIVAIQTGAAAGPARSDIGSGAVTIIDTHLGRLVTEHVTRGDKGWMIVSPGTRANLASAVLTVMRNLPAREHWYSHRKVV